MDLRISELQMRPSTQVLEDQLARLEDRMQDQHEEIAILCGQICHKALVPPASLPVASSSLEEEERSKLDYTDDPPTPHVEGTVQGTGCRVSERLSEANSPVVDWDGTPSKYLTPHLTPESSSNILILLPGRWSGGYCLCIFLITSYRI